MRVREIVAASAPIEDLCAIHAIEEACVPEFSPREPSRSLDEAIAFYRHPPTTHERHHWLVGTVGVAGLYVHSPTAVYVHMSVVPDHRRQGIGTALLDAARARCVELGVAALHGHHFTPAGAAFAARAGAIDAQRDVRSILELREATLPEPVLPSGWRFATWIGRVPDDHIQAYVRARAAMDDAPMPDGVMIPTDDVERVRAMEESLALRERELRVTAALSDDGEVGAFTDLRVSPGSPVGFTDDTATVAAFRGRGLARGVKLESLRRLRDDHPEITLVTTMNAQENRVMRHINESIGFEAVVTTTTATLAL
jgi:GNAT superfamily N-acetyltransferase